MQLSAYLTFDGNCREAMLFYKTCFGGNLEFQTIGDSPLCKKLPDFMKNFILHASLTNPGLTIMASDMVPETGLKTGNVLSLVLHCKNATELNAYYEKLSDNGTVVQNPITTVHGKLLAGTTDKFGVNWFLQSHL